MYDPTIPSKMNDIERAMFQAIEDEFYGTVDSRLRIMGYTGSFKNPFDPEKNVSPNESYRKVVSDFFRMRPHPISVTCRVEGPGLTFYIDCDKIIDKELAKWVIDFASNPARRQLNLYQGAEYYPPRSARLNFPDIHEPEKILEAFGIDPAKISLYADEDIEVDLDTEDPLGLDFPPPVDAE